MTVSSCSLSQISASNTDGQLTADFVLLLLFKIVKRTLIALRLQILPASRAGLGAMLKPRQDLVQLLPRLIYLLCYTDC